MSKIFGRRNMIIGIVMIAMMLSACGAKQSGEPYADVIAALGDDELYALLEMEYDNLVCVTTDKVYDEGSESSAGVYCEVYYNNGKETTHVGSLASDGTAYPLSFSKDGIYVGLAHGLEKYCISEKDGKLYLANAVYVTYDDDGGEEYTAITDGVESEVTEQEYQELFEEYADSTIIHFAYGASDGCLNEMPES
jgi:hypothetical protein